MLVVLRHLFQCFWVMHRSGLNLYGEFGASNMLVYTSLEVRTTGVHFSWFTRSDGDLDYAQFVASVEEVFTQRESVPNDIRTWLELIRKGVNGRNCSQHLSKYKEKYMVRIIENDFLGFVARFQLNLFRTGLLPFFHLEATMG